MKSNKKGLIFCLILLAILWTLHFINDATIENEVVECILSFCVWTIVVWNREIERMFDRKELNDKKSRRIQ